MRPFIMRCFFLVLALTAPLMASAAEWYQFDVVIIKPRTKPSLEERFQPLTTHAIPENAIQLKQSGGEQEAFVQLPESASTLSSKMAALKKNYNILWSKSWRMPVAQGGKTPILVQGGNSLDDTYQIEGTLSFSVRRYLHVSSNLWINTLKPDFPENTSSPENTNLSEELALAEDDPTEELLPYTQNRHFQVEQRLQPNKIIYLDNPDAGVLIKVTPWKTS